MHADESLRQRRRQALASALTIVLTLACNDAEPAMGGASTAQGADAGKRAHASDPPVDTGSDRGSAGSPAPQAGLRIELPTGALLGKQVGSTREFLGIPYAEPPVGDLRFAPPRAAKPWNGMRDATAFGPDCPQLSISWASAGAHDEDCLNLNVYTPAQVTSRLPVMVFLHGGAFVTGAGSEYDGKILAEMPVVVVTLNYRLGALGFFSSPALDATRLGAPSGSDAIRDQQLALQWVQDNIANFGGDASNVTVFGESAGAISGCVHYVSPSSRRLAARYIIESGSCTDDGLGVRYKQDADALGQRLIDGLCAGASDALACLRGKSAQEVVDWGIDLGMFGAGWLPTIEGDGGVLPDTPERLIASANALAPLIVGTNKNEWGLYQQLGAAAPSSRADYQTLIAQEFGAMSDQVSDQYPVSSDAEANDVYVQLVSDVSYRCPARSLALLASGRGARVFMYSFEQGTALHSQELDYVFGGDVFSYYGGGPPVAALQSSVQRYWTGFASDSEPNAASDPTWPPYRVDDDQYMVLVDPPRASTGLARGSCDFWRNYFSQGGTISLD
jgi:para-nitrobenzyl esterase